ncbi:unnamed protein product [Paramecium sonneborni]|uniref:Uncharacterized protein n=1 Tax=Paramecium sonneborni TaxID=65129 RepID=A0A8S1L8H9_9CILI|nr:unnamed protein product [Paramecium sonneborni]
MFHNIINNIQKSCKKINITKSIKQNAFYPFSCYFT